MPGLLQAQEVNTTEPKPAPCFTGRLTYTLKQTDSRFPDQKSLYPDTLVVEVGENGWRASFRGGSIGDSMTLWFLYRNADHTLYSVDGMRKEYWTHPDTTTLPKPKLATLPGGRLILKKPVKEVLATYPNGHTRTIAWWPDSLRRDATGMHTLPFLAGRSDRWPVQMTEKTKNISVTLTLLRIEPGTLPVHLDIPPGYIKVDFQWRTTRNRWW